MGNSYKGKHWEPPKKKKKIVLFIFYFVTNVLYNTQVISLQIYIIMWLWWLGYLNKFMIYNSDN